MTKPTGPLNWEEFWGGFHPDDFAVVVRSETDFHRYVVAFVSRHPQRAQGLSTEIIRARQGLEVVESRMSSSVLPH